MLARQRHVGVEVEHDPHRAGDDEADDQRAEGERERVVGVVRAGGDVQEEDEVDAHLGDRQRREPHQHARPVEERGAARHPERGDGQHGREHEADHIVAHRLGDGMLAEVAAFAGRGVVRCVVLAHCSVPSR